MAKISAFIARSFDDSDSPKIDPILKFLDSFRSNGFICETAERAEVESVSKKVRGIIDECQVFVGILTKRYPVYDLGPRFRAAFAVILNQLTPSKWTPPLWVMQECGYALRGEKKLVLFLETGVEIPGLQGDLEYIRYDPTDPVSAFQRASEMINTLLAAAEGKFVETTVSSAAQGGVAEAPAPPNATEQEAKPDMLEHFIVMYSAIRAHEWDAAAKAYEGLLAEVRKREPDEEIYWKARYQSELFQAGRSEALEELKSIASEHPEDPNPLGQLGFCFAHFQRYEDAVTYFEEAARLCKTREGFARMKLEAADAYRHCRGLEKSREVLVGLLASSEDFEDATKFRILNGLFDVSKDSKDGISALAFAELALGINPAHSDLRFSVAYYCGELEYNEMSLRHYKVLCEHDPAMKSAMNNLGVAYSNCGFPILAFSMYKRAFELGDTLSASNIGYQYLGAGAKEEAVAILKQAQLKKGCVSDVDRCLAAVSERSDLEEKEESDKLEVARKQGAFLAQLGSALLATEIPMLDGIWNFPFGDISLHLSGVKLRGSVEKTIEKPPLVFATLLGSAREPSKEIEITSFLGKITGRYCRYSLTKRSIKPQTSALLAPLETPESSSEGHIVFENDGSSGRAAELKDGRLAEYYTVRRTRVGD